MPTSVMPKGVEHHSATVLAAELVLMPTSVMPKGVEHSYSKASQWIRQ